MTFCKNGADARDLFCIRGSFGELSGAVEMTDSRILAKSEGIALACTQDTDKNGVLTLAGKLTNTAAADAILSAAAIKFTYDGGEYEVYTQYNGWQNESMGGWQPLVATVGAEVCGVRNAFSAAPFLVLWNKQTGRGTAYHLLADSAWVMKASKVAIGGEASIVVVEMGIKPDGLCMKLAPGEVCALPGVIAYDIRNKLDMDAWKLHAYMNERYPRREMPVIYNTWLARFDKITFDNVADQIGRARELGVEYFVIDAGWFGDGPDMWGNRGNWYENTTAGFEGRMAELSDAVRASGMGFGFWLEIESADRLAKVLAEHPDYYIDYRGAKLLNFANPDACEWLFETVTGLVAHYDATFIKFDFNQDMKFDAEESAFLRYYDGYRKLIRRLHEACPQVYFENCASGGLRMALNNGFDFDSYWLSDNQGPFEGLRILKETLRRMPGQWIERWAAIRSLDGFAPVYSPTENTCSKLLSTDDAVWGRIISLDPSYLQAFLTGGPIGFSCDLNALNEKDFAWLKAFVAEKKAERPFWQSACARILCDTESMLVLEYHSEDFAKIELFVISSKVRQNAITVYPVLDKAASYRIGDEIRTGAVLDADGIRTNIPGDYKAVRITLERI